MKTTNEKELLIKANWSVLTSVCGIGSENFYLELERLIWKRRARSAANGAVFNQPRLQMTAPVLSFRLNYGEFFARLNFLPDHSGPHHHHHHHPSQHLLFRSKRALMTQRPYQSFNDISLCSLCSLCSLWAAHCAQWSCIHLSSLKKQPPYIYRASYTRDERHWSPL